MKSKIPNILTWLRICLIPVFVIVYLTNTKYSHQLSAIVFFIAGLSDFLDGYLARRWDQTSHFGAFLDPVADKLLVATALILIVSDAHAELSLWIVLCAIVIIGREITVSALREWMADSGLRDAVKVQSIGKWKTFFQVVALFALLYRAPLFNLPTYFIGFLSLIFAAVLTLVSMSIYLNAANKALKK